MATTTRELAGAMESEGAAFWHGALMYAGSEEFVPAVMPFLREGVAAEEPMLVAVDAEKIARLTAALGEDASAVCFVDMVALGTNPARIIPAWRDFVSARDDPDRPVRGIGEPIWPGRAGAELAECHRHEELLNVAFAETRAFRLLCPYDTTRLEPEVVAQARCTHPYISADGQVGASPAYAGLERIAAPLTAPLGDPATPPVELHFERGGLGAVRTAVMFEAVKAGLDTARTHDLVLAVNELATNSVRHGGGTGALLIWREDGALVCEVADRGLIADPLAARVRPTGADTGGYGLWMVNQLVDLMQIRATPDGGAVRVHMRL